MTVEWEIEHQIMNLRTQRASRPAVVEKKGITHIDNDISSTRPGNKFVGIQSYDTYSKESV